MQTRTYQFWTQASQANAASITIVNPGWIVCVKWASYLDSVADNSYLQAELSFQSSSQIATHNALGVIDTIAQFQNVQASPVGQSTTGVNQCSEALRIPVLPGNILYLNTSNSGTATIKCLMVVMEQD